MATEKDTEKAAATIQTVSNPMQTITVTLDRIVADDEFNVRQATTKDSEKLYQRLKEDIEVNGVTNPLVVSDAGDGNYNLIAGFTRYRALCEIEKEARKRGGKGIPPVTVKVTVKAYEDEVDAHFDNVRDNMLRGDLSPYDIAVKAKMLRDQYEQTGPAIARGLGMDRDYCNNLMRALDKVDPRIIEAWSEGHEKAAVNFLFDIAGKDRETQWSKWLVRTGQVNENGEPIEGGEGGGAVKPPKEPTVKRPSLSVLDSALESIKASDKDDEWKAGATAALKFALGRVKSIPGAYDPRKAQASNTGGRKGKGNNAGADA